MAELSHLLRRIQPLLEASFSRHQERLCEELTRLHDVLRLQGLYRSRVSILLAQEAYERDIEARRSSIVKIVKGTVAIAEGKPLSEDAQGLRALVSACLGSHIRESEKKLQGQVALWDLQLEDRFELGTECLLAARDAELEIVLQPIDWPP